ncbi:MAG: DUF4386 domain-containing protein [Caldilineaceae bacterium]|nr:DUF4386 domain-containing protein [Caldilineaceae bacterium]
MNSHRNAARLFGIFFIIAFLAYGTGSGIIGSITGTPDFLANVHANSTTIVVGVILIALVHTFVNIGLPVIMLPILKPFHKTFTYGYLSLGIASTTVAVVGAIFWLLLIPLAGEYVKAGSAATGHAETMGIVLKMGGAYAYQIAMAIWGLGGLLFVSVLYQSKLVPRLLSLWGMIGYIIFISGTILELFGFPVGVLLALPGGLFELSLSVWLIAKGFNSSAIASVATK